MLAEERLNEGFKQITIPIQHFFRNISSNISIIKTDYDKMIKDLSMIDEQIKEYEDRQNLEAEKIRELKKDLADAQSDFQEYDAKYQAIEAEGIRIKNEIDALAKQDKVT